MFNFFAKKERKSKLRKDGENLGWLGNKLRKEIWQGEEKRITMLGRKIQLRIIIRMNLCLHGTHANVIFMFSFSLESYFGTVLKD